MVDGPRALALRVSRRGISLIDAHTRRGCENRHETRGCLWRHYLCATCVGRLTRGEDPPIVVRPCCISAEYVGRAGRRGGHRRPQRRDFDVRPHTSSSLLSASHATAIDSSHDRSATRKSRFGFPLMGLLAQRNVLSSKAARSSGSTMYKYGRWRLGPLEILKAAEPPLEAAIAKYT